MIYASDSAAWLFCQVIIIIIFVFRNHLRLGQFTELITQPLKTLLVYY